MTALGRKEGAKGDGGLDNEDIYIDRHKHTYKRAKISNNGLPPSNHKVAATPRGKNSASADDGDKT